MKTLKLSFIVIAICSSSAVFATDTVEEKSIDQMLGSLKIEKMQAELMVETMARRGKLNNEEASRVKREIASVKEEDEKNFREEAMERISSKNSFATK